MNSLKTCKKGQEKIETAEEIIANMSEEDFTSQNDQKSKLAAVTAKSKKHHEVLKASNKKGKKDIEIKEEEQIKLLREQLANKKHEIQELKDRLLRLQAEFENYKKRMIREKNDFSRYALEKIINNLLPVIDNLERAVESARKKENYQALVTGIEMVLAQLLDVLKKEGLENIKALGEKFDPNKHEAVMQIESHEHSENEIAQELQKGYALNDRVIRASMVAVAKKTSKEKTN